MDEFITVSLKMSAGSIYNILLIGLTCSLVPLGLLNGILAAVGVNLLTLRWNGEAVHGFQRDYYQPDLLLHPGAGVDRHRRQPGLARIMDLRPVSPADSAHLFHRSGLMQPAARAIRPDLIARPGASGNFCLFFYEQCLIPKNMVVTATASKTDAVKILEDLNRQLAPDVQRIAEIRRAG